MGCDGCAWLCKHAWIRLHQLPGRYHADRPRQGTRTPSYHKPSRRRSGKHVLVEKTAQLQLSSKALIGIMLSTLARRGQASEHNCERRSQVHPAKVDSISEVSGSVFRWL